MDHRNKTIEIFELKNGDYEPFTFAAEKGKVRSKQLKGFELDIAVLR